jgi:hypothetical protein
MSAEIIFSNSADVNPTIAELVELDFDVEILEDWIDDCGPVVWILASAITELNPAAFFDRVKTIVEPLGGWVVEAGYAARWRGRHLVEVGWRPGHSAAVTVGMRGAAPGCSRTATAVTSACARHIGAASEREKV